MPASGSGVLDAGGGGVQREVVEKPTSSAVSANPRAATRFPALLRLLDHLPEWRIHP